MIDWYSVENHFFLNPKFPEAKSRFLRGMFDAVQDRFRSHLFLLTSGTTAQSVQDFKWVALSKEAFLCGARAANQHLKSEARDVWIHTLPEFHVGGLAIWARSHLSGAQVVRLSQWKPQDFVELISTRKGTLASLVPAQVYDLIQGEWICPPSLRAIVVGGGALASALLQKGKALGWPLLPSYGMTEASSQIATATLEGQDASLHVLPHFSVEVVDAEGKLRIRGDSLLTAYVFSHAGQVQVQDPKRDGWFYTEDRGFLQGQQLSVLGRTRDFIKIGGESVELNRLQEVLKNLCLDLKISSDVTLFPFPDARLGHVIYLLSDPQLGAERASELIEKFNHQVLGFERIRQWKVLGEIPRTALGKLISEECLQGLKTNAAAP